MSELGFRREGGLSFLWDNRGVSGGPRLPGGRVRARPGRPISAPLSPRAFLSELNNGSMNVGHQFFTKYIFGFLPINGGSSLEVFAVLNSDPRTHYLVVRFLVS